jgi:predicted HTH domain antitoxin
MQITIPDDISREAGLNPRECLIELVVRLYADRRISFAQALRITVLSRQAFEEELARRDISLYTVQDLVEDVSALKELGRL